MKEEKMSKQLNLMRIGERLIVEGPLHNNPYLIDIGLFQGNSAITILKWWESKGVTNATGVGYDPQKETCSIATIKAKKAEVNLVTFNKGVSWLGGETILNLYDESDSASLFKRQQDIFNSQDTIKVCSFQEVMDSWEYIDLLTMNAEGIEFQILASLTSAMAKKIRQISAELHFDIKDSFLLSKGLSNLEKVGYKVIVISLGSKHASLVAYKE